MSSLLDRKQEKLHCNQTPYSLPKFCCNQKPHIKSYYLKYRLLYLDAIIPNYTVITNQIGDTNTLLDTILQDLSLIINHKQCHIRARIR